MAQVEATAPLLDVNEVARRLGTEPRFVRRLVAERRIEFHKLGRHVRISEAAPGRVHQGRTCPSGDICPQEGGLMPGKRRFGRVRELPSGRWQARYKGPDGLDRPAPHTFDSKASAERWLTLTEAEIIQGDWIDPDAGRVLFGKTPRTGSRNGRVCGRRRSSCTGTCCAVTSSRLRYPVDGRDP